MLYLCSVFKTQLKPNFYVDTQVCISFLGLTESNDSSVNEINLRNRLNLRIQAAYLESIMIRGQYFVMKVHTSTSPE